MQWNAMQTYQCTPKKRVLSSAQSKAQQQQQQRPHLRVSTYAALHLLNSPPFFPLFYIQPEFCMHDSTVQSFPAPEHLPATLLVVVVVQW